VRTVGVVTVGRSDYGIYLPILRRIQADPALRLRLLVGGMHLAPQFGLTSRHIEADGFEIGDRIEMLLASDTPEGIAKSMGLGVAGFSQAYARERPDILVVLGDRFEMFAAALAALPFKIAVAHIHGGEVTEGAIDDALRHAMTKLSHLHFVATEEYARRVVQLGEEPWRVVVCGAPSLDNLGALRLRSREELERDYGLELARPFLLVTFHPVTLEYERTRDYTEELLAALAAAALPVIFTAPNADTAHHEIVDLIRTYVRAQPSAWLVEQLGTRDYFSMLALAAAMVGNSSSGLIEAPSLGLPVVNVGTRQDGRVRGANVIDVGYGRAEILAGIRRALEPEFRQRALGRPNPYGAGHAAEIVVGRLAEIALDDALTRKRFYDLKVVEPLQAVAGARG